MPIPGARYRFKRLPGGKVIRLAFKDNEAVEVRKFHKGPSGKLVKGKFLKKPGSAEKLRAKARKKPLGT